MLGVVWGGNSSAAQAQTHCPHRLRGWAANFKLSWTNGSPLWLLIHSNIISPHVGKERSWGSDGDEMNKPLSVWVRPGFEVLRVTLSLMCSFMGSPAPGVACSSWLPHALPTQASLAWILSITALSFLASFRKLTERVDSPDETCFQFSFHSLAQEFTFLDQWFSSLSMPQNHLELSWGGGGHFWTQIAGSHPQNF